MTTGSHLVQLKPFYFKGPPRQLETEDETVQGLNHYWTHKKPVQIDLKIIDYILLY